MLPQHSQDLLRAARSGKIYKRPAPVEEEEADPEVVAGEKPEKKDDDLKEKGFAAKAWKQIPRHLEAGDVEYLAKRRKGLITISKNTIPIPTVTKATVKRTDAAGNEYVQDVVVPHGQHVDGEVIAKSIIPDPNAVAADPLAVQATPPRRKGPVPRKKLKGPGRGRKKKPVPPTSVPSVDANGSAIPPTPVPVEEANGPDVSVENNSYLYFSDTSQGIKIEADTTATPTQTEDTEMGEGSNVPSDDDEGDDGEDGDDGDDDEGSNADNASPSKATRTASPLPTSLPTMASVPDIAMTGVEPLQPLAKILTDQERLEVKSGSPLKNLALTISTLNSPLESPNVSDPTSSIAAPITEQTERINQEMVKETAESAPTILPPPPPEPTKAEEKVAVETLREEQEEEEMLLDIVNQAENSKVGAPPVAPAPKDLSEALSEPLEDIKVEEPVAPPTVEAVVVPQSEEVAEEEEEDDDFPDLLGGLEKSLDSKPSAN